MLNEMLYAPHTFHCWLLAFTCVSFCFFSFVFLEFSNASDAANAIKTANGYKLDKNHTFVVNSFSDLDK